MLLLRFFRDGLREMFRGSALYWGWLAALASIALLGLWFYLQQLTQGLAITGMSDQMSWGLYIANFASRTSSRWS